MAVERNGYSAAQIALHWTVVVLVVFQFLAHDGMEHAWRGYTQSREVAADDYTFAVLHICAGGLIFVCALARLWLRFTRGAPPPPRDEHPALRFLANATHFVLYALIVMLPLSGSAAWFLGAQAAAGAHVIGKNILFFVAVLHIAGALFQHFVMRSRVLRRMMVPERA